MSKYIDSYINFLEIEKNCSKNTLISYKCDLDLFFKFIQKSEEEIKIIDVRNYMAYLKNDRGNKAKSIGRRITSLKSYFSFLVENEILGKNEIAKIKMPKVPRSIPKFRSEVDIHKILKSADKEDRAIFEVLYSTGCRISELTNMNIENIDFEKRLILIMQGKGSKDRMVFLSVRAKKHLETYILNHRAKLLKKVEKRMEISADARKAVFLSIRGKRMSVRTIQHKLKEIAKKIGIKHATPHQFRHSLASHLLMNNTNIRVVQNLLGHASLETTQIYANITDKYAQNEYDRNLTIR